MLVVGVTLALLVAAVVMTGLMRPPLGDLTALIRTLAITSIISLGAGFLLYRRGLARSPSLSLTLIMSYVWSALLILFNVLVMAQQMFFSPHDLGLAVVLLLFGLVIATTFGIFVSALVTDSLRQLADKAQQIAAGDLSARVRVIGRDEAGQVALAFNHMAEQLQQAARQREELEKMRRDLIAWTSHDLRTPLTSIRVMIEALNDGVVYDPETVQRYYRTIRADIVALNSLIDDLFELAQLDAGGLVLDLAPHSLNDLLSDTLETFSVLARQREITLEGQIEPGIDTVVMSAPKISRVLSNLIGNALQYTPAGGKVEVLASRKEGGIRVVVQDSGSGFAAADLSRVFEKFYRGEQARTRATGGAGLGLAIAQAIVEAHGGHMWASNRPAGGAQVGFFLPQNRP
jgi:signal transduction histidine kinase